MTASHPSKLRTLLVLGRTSNLPTVWSNCLAGWWLGGGGNVAALAQASVALTLIYIGGMFLNDAFDVAFDRAHRQSRPIPSGAISAKEVWLWGFGLLAAGLLGLVWLGKTTAIFGIILTLCIIFYDAVHKSVSFGPVIMSSCRFLVYLVSASIAVEGVTGSVVWRALALACYIIGLSYLARKESFQSTLPNWTVIFLAAPLLITVFENDDQTHRMAWIFCGLLTGWIIWSLRFVINQTRPDIGASVSRLLAGIILVDLLSVVDKPVFWPILGLWFGLALVFQRVIPAT